MALTVTEYRRGKCLKLNFAIMISGSEKPSQVFNIDDLAEVRFKFKNNHSTLEISMSFRKHESAKDITIKVDVNSDKLKYSQQWMCTEHWVDWQRIGTMNCDDYCLSSMYLFQIPINITVTEGKSFTAENIYEDTDWTDFVLSAVDGSVSVHRACLVAHSDVFKTMLGSEWKETAEGRILIDGVTLQTLKHLKQYMYMGTLPDEGLRPLLLIAKCYLIDNLKEACVSKLARTVTSEHLEDLLDFAVENKITELFLAILQMTPDGVVHGAHEMKKKQICEKNGDKNSEDKINKVE